MGEFEKKSGCRWENLKKKSGFCWENMWVKMEWEG